MKKHSRLIVLLLVIAMTFTLAGCKSSAAKSTEALISSIGEVTADSKDAVEAAEAAYAALSDKDRANVENAADLTAAREALDSALRVKGVEDLIKGLGAITVDSQAAVEAAEAALRALPAAEASLVENASALEAAREQLDEAILEAARTAVLGSWNTRVDLTGAFLYGLIQGLGDYSDYLSRPAEDYFSNVSFSVVLTLNEDGTFALVPAEGWEDELVDGIAPALEAFLEDFMVSYLSTYLKSFGVTDDLSTAEALNSYLRAYMGTDLKGVIEDSIGMDFVSFIRELLSESDITEEAKVTGLFEVLPNEGKIIFALDDPDKPGSAVLDEAVFDLYELAGDKLTLRAGSGDVLTLYANDGDDEIAGLPAELVFTRAA